MSYEQNQINQQNQNETHNQNQNQNQIDNVSRLAKLEEWRDSGERRFQRLENDNGTLKELAVLVRLQKDSMVIMSNTLVEIKDSNNKIKHQIEGIHEDINEVKVDVDKVTQKVVNIEASDTINLPLALKKAGGIFLAALVTGIATFVLIRFGFK